jgi:hypothetical protein
MYIYITYLSLAVCNLDCLVDSINFPCSAVYLPLLPFILMCTKSIKLFGLTDKWDELRGNDDCYVKRPSYFLLFKAKGNNNFHTNFDGITNGGEDERL